MGPLIDLINRELIPQLNRLLPYVQTATEVAADTALIVDLDWFPPCQESTRHESDPPPASHVLVMPCDCSEYVCPGCLQYVMETTQLDAIWVCAQCGDRYAGVLAYVIRVMPL